MGRPLFFGKIETVAVQDFKLKANEDSGRTKN
jgi:hypothetical protein